MGTHLWKNIFQITLDRSQMDFEVGHTMTLTCTVVGFPVPVVKWYKNNTPLPKSERFSVDAESTLTVKKLTVIDGGVYSCRATNVHQSVSESMKVTVKEGEEPPPECEDNPYFARCDLIVRANYCMSLHYGKFCCKTCTEAGLLQPGWEEEVRIRMEAERQNEEAEKGKLNPDEARHDSEAEDPVGSEGSGREGSSSGMELADNSEQSGNDSADEVLSSSKFESSTGVESEGSGKSEVSTEAGGSGEAGEAGGSGEAEGSGSGEEGKFMTTTESGMETDDGMSSEDEASASGEESSPQTESGEASAPE